VGHRITNWLGSWNLKMVDFRLSGSIAI